MGDEKLITSSHGVFTVDHVSVGKHLPQSHTGTLSKDNSGRNSTLHSISDWYMVIGPGSSTDHF